MATRRTKKRFTIKFEVGLAGLFGIGVVSFCIFLWMFLFGVWTGQTLLTPSDEDSTGLHTIAEKLGIKDNESDFEDLTASKGVEKKKQVKVIDRDDTSTKKVPSFFAIQVAAFKDSSKATKAVLQWRARDYDSFYLAPEKPAGSYYRVFVGNFDKMSEAKKQAKDLKKTSKDKFFITLVSSLEKRFP